MNDNQNSFMYSERDLVSDISQIDSFQQNWSYSDINNKFCIELPGLILVVKSISFVKPNLSFQGNILSKNGKQMPIPAQYREAFIQNANKNGKNIVFCYNQDRNQLLLKCSLSFQFDLSIQDQINILKARISDCMPRFQMALQVLGLKQKNNKLSFTIKKQLLKLKKNVISEFNNNSTNDNLDQFSSNSKQNSCVTRVKQVQQVSSSFFTTQPVYKKGGYFQVHKKNSTIHKQSGEVVEKQLAWKTPLNNGLPSAFLENKLLKEIQFISKIKDDKYLLNYYVKQNDRATIYMDYASGLLKDQIHNNNLSISDLIGFADQLVSAVAVLHDSNIVHRDLKPQNILIQGKSIKIIDYAESAMTDQQFYPNHLLGCTLPYSPIQCILGKQQGFNKKEIDLWSIAIIFYEMAFKSVPMYFTRWIGGEILEKWRSTSDFSISPFYRKRKGLRNIQQTISLLTIRGIQVKPQQRLSLRTFKKIINNLKQLQQKIASSY